MTLNLKNSDEGAAKLAGLLFCKWFFFMELVHRTFRNWVCLNRQFETQEKLFLTDIAPVSTYGQKQPRFSKCNTKINQQF